MHKEIRYRPIALNPSAQAEVMAAIADSIVGFYDHLRLHAWLGYLPPTVRERKQAEPPIGVPDIT